MQKTKTDWKKYIIFTCIFLSTFLGVLFGTSYYNVKSSYYVNSLPDDLKGNINILVAGIDDMNNSCDAIVVATISPKDNKIELTSISPNSMIKVIDTNQPLKRVYSIGGEDMLIEKTSELLGIDIKYYILSRFSTFESIINTLGGVKYSIPHDMQYKDSKQNLEINLKKGQQTLGGSDALKLIRYSYSLNESTKRDNTIKLFLKEVLNQKLNDKYIPKIPAITKEIINNTITNLLTFDTDTYIAIARSVISKNITINTIEGNYTVIDGYDYFIPNLESISSIFSN